MTGKKLFFALFLPLLLFLSFNKHSKDEPGTYHSVIWSDAAGYYVYLPLFLIYDGDAEEMPEKIEERCGEGFDVLEDEGKLHTKYPIGPAVLQAPFFLGAHAFAETLGYEATGFSWIYHAAIMIAGVFYAWAGCILLFRFLRRSFFKERESALLVAILLFGTHLFYYSIDAPGMSHVYSFFLFSSFLFLVPKILRSPTRGKAMLLGGIAAAILLCRPSNLIFLGAPFLMSFDSDPSFRDRMQRLNELRWLLLPALAAALLCLVPQSLYWHWLSDSPLIYSYGDEGFSNWDRPRILEVLFSTKNGLIPYTPLYLLILGGMGMMTLKGERNGWIHLGLFLLLTYIVASWWNWWFGCSFGGRNYVEYLAPFSIPLGYLLFRTRSKLLRTLLILSILLFVYANLELVYYYDDCYYGGIWDWQAYWDLY